MSTTSDLDAEARLMRSAQKFGIAFDESRRWGDDIKRLEYTLAAWRELALAAVEYAKAVATEHADNPELREAAIQREKKASK